MRNINICYLKVRPQYKSTAKQEKMKFRSFDIAEAQLGRYSLHSAVSSIKVVK